MASRGGFSSRLGFILSAAGSAVGIGNIVKFPFEVGNGGGAAFVVLYLLFCFLLCFPVMVAEIAIGRGAARNAIGAFKALGYPKWSFIGKMGVLSGVLILSFYNVVAAWALGYFIEMLLGNFGIGNQFSAYIKDVIKISVYALVFMAATALIVSRGVSGGIERASKILMPTLLAMILLLVVYALTLPGAMKGLEFYLVPDFSKMKPTIIYSALGQAFFSLSLGMSTHITYGSYLNKKENIVSSAALITLTDVFIAFVAGLLMFPLVFSQGLSTDGGIGLIFVALPGVFESFGPILGIVVGSFFFLLLSFAALTSTVSLLEVPVAYVVDEHKMRRSRAVWLIATLIFIIGIPSVLANGYSEFFTNFVTYLGSTTPTDFMSMIGHLANDTFLPLGGFLGCLFAAYVWKKENLYKEIEQGYPNFRDSFVAKYLDIAMRIVCPLVLGILFIFTITDRFLGISFF